MSLVSSSSANSEVSNDEEEKRQREEEERRREAEEEKRIEEEKKLREEAEKLRLYQELKAKEDARRKQIEENAKRKEQEKARLEAERIQKEKEKEKARLEEERRREAMEAEAREQEEKLRKERELAEHLITRMSIEDEELKKSESKDKEVMKKIKVTGQRSKKPTMAREWRKLKEKQKQSDSHKESVVVEKMEVDTTPEVTPLPPRAKYVPPVFKENETYSDRHKTFLTGAWPHNNKKGIPTPSELAEAGFFFIGPGDYCRWGLTTSASQLTGPSLQVLPVRPRANVLGTLRESLDPSRLSGA